MYKDIFEAAQKGSVDDVRFFIEQGVDVNVKDDEIGATPLHKAAERKNISIKILEYLIEQGANVNEKIPKYGLTPLHLAVIHKCDIDIVKYLVELGADVNESSWAGGTLPCAVRYHSRVEILEYLIEAGADIDRNDVIAIAVEYHAKAEVFKFLIAKGAEVNGRDYHSPSGMTPIEFVDSEEIKMILREAGAKTGDEIDILEGYDGYERTW